MGNHQITHDGTVVFEALNSGKVGIYGDLVLGDSGSIKVVGTSVSPQASTVLNNVSLNSLGSTLFQIYPASGAQVFLRGVVPRVDGQIIIVQNLNSADVSNFVQVDAEDGSNTDQNRFGASVRYSPGPVVSPVVIPGGCAAAWRYQGPIGSSGRWRLIWLGGAVLSDFLPQSVSQVADGGFWLPGIGVTGLGTAGFQWEDQSGNGNHFVQATVGAQPTPGVGPSGAPIWTLDGGDTAQVTVPTADLLWTTAGMYAYWGRLNADDSNFRLWIEHDDGASQRRISFWKYNTPGQIQAFPSANGSDVVTCGASTDHSLWHYYEWVFDGSLATADRLRLFVDRVEVPLTGDVGATLFASTAPLRIWGNGSLNILGDVGPLYITNGIPSTGNRERLRRHRAPILI